MKKETDFIVIGSGIAGLRAAIGLSQQGAKVTVLTKDRLSESNTEYAQGGVAVVLSEDDQTDLHYHDTLEAGADLCDESAVRVLVEEGPHYITELIEMGARFDAAEGKLLFTKEAAHSRRRILHAQDSTGKEIVRTLLAKAFSIPAIELLPHATTLDLILIDGRAVGVCYVDTATQRVCQIYGRAIILTTGGAGQIYAHTTNPEVAKGDGMAMAYRAGAKMCDMEFVQFHPTALNIANAPNFLLTEALRGEGGYLINEQGQRFMAQYDKREELAPRDIVSRSIVSEMKRNNSRVYLDVTHLPGDFLRERFPKIYQTCLNYNYDITINPIPVSPAAHYFMGGVRTNTEGETSIAGLYAAGEVASTGVHGANRLASNSLLEGLVFGARSAQTALAKSSPLPVKGLDEANARYQDIPINQRLDHGVRQQVSQLMWDEVGILRHGEGLARANEELTKLAANKQYNMVTENFITVAHIIAQGALFRKESRGGHYRSDYPERNDHEWRNHVIQQIGQAPTKIPLS